MLKKPLVLVAVIIVSVLILINVSNVTSADQVSQDVCVSESSKGFFVYAYSEIKDKVLSLVRLNSVSA